MTLNREVAPAIQIDTIDFPTVAVNDHFHFIEGATQEYTFLQLVFDAGKIQSEKKLIADCCCDMLLSGTKNKNAFELNELLDYYGASIEPILGDDDLTIRIYCLNKQLLNILPVIKEILSESIFPKDEAEIILAKWKQRQQINFKKTDYLANRKFRNVLFGQRTSIRQISGTK
jgi:zinc protease